MIIYIVTSRYGVQMNEPAYFKNRDNAINHIKKGILDCMVERNKQAANYYKKHGIEQTLKWGVENDICMSYNSIRDANGDIIVDTCAADKEDWLEYSIDSLNTDNLRE